ncbi:MAG: hypothetical protein KKG47_11945 [Proteobacteria bacterium]|nr:hypothetical protein [Pseudomonadota bacterium]MBU1738431.1 hypothetical protein [Pseudomonadota bacterium]
MEKDSFTGRSILMPKHIYLAMVTHCFRKLSGEYLENEIREAKAFGLIGGIRNDRGYEIRACLPLLKNVRTDSDQCDFMDGIMAEHAIPSETPLEKRGWVADPGELMSCTRKLRELDCILLGTYHMHRVAWEHDKTRDTPTKLDTILGKGSRLLMFIISMVDPERPILRAFSEGDIREEIPIQIIS